MIERFCPFLLLFAAACSGPPAIEYDPYNRSGQMIALSGGDRGAQGACISCHGIKGEGDGKLTPRLAGLDQGYLARQLLFYAEGQRSHPQMTDIARRLTVEERLKVAAYYAGLPVTTVQGCPAPARAVALYRTGDRRRGIAACAACHGASGEGVGRGNPPLAGQPAAYLEEQLRAWKSGRRYGDPEGTMMRISQRLRPEEIRTLADHAARLPGGSARRESPEACPPARRADPRNGA